MKILSFGAGMQSTALALMSCENAVQAPAPYPLVPVYDAVIFCDLGLEPLWVKEQMEFTINLTTADMARATDWAGVRSGKDYDKWRETGLTPCPGRMVKCPYIDESPLSIECRVKSVIPLGSHHMFLAEVINVLADERFIDPATDRFDLGQAGLMNYTHGHYYAQGELLGRFGFSVKKK